MKFNDNDAAALAVGFIITGYVQALYLPLHKVSMAAALAGGLVAWLTYRMAKAARRRYRVAVIREASRRLEIEGRWRAATERGVA